VCGKRKMRECDEEWGSAGGSVEGYSEEGVAQVG